MAHIIYVNRSNKINLVLESRDAGGEWAPINLSGVTEMALDFGAIVIDSTSSPTAISWAIASVPLYDDDVYVVTLSLGSSGLTAGRYVAHLIVTNPEYPNGLVWSNLAIQVSNLE